MSKEKDTSLDAVILEILGITLLVGATIGLVLAMVIYGIIELCFWIF
jgi:hypothetical protein